MFLSKIYFLFFLNFYVFKILIYNFRIDDKKLIKNPINKVFKIPRISDVSLISTDRILRQL